MDEKWTMRKVQSGIWVVRWADKTEHYSTFQDGERALKYVWYVIGFVRGRKGK
ncbi:MAG: hypothetical protein OK436_05175 [Thaumarchaeota archaeon]|nr:hypothetical protein [Nitrososphaerota archaeon]